MSQPITIGYLRNLLAQLDMEAEDMDEFGDAWRAEVDAVPVMVVLESTSQQEASVQLMCHSGDEWKRDHHGMGEALVLVVPQPPAPKPDPTAPFWEWIKA